MLQPDAIGTYAAVLEPILKGAAEGLTSALVTLEIPRGQEGERKKIQHILSYEEGRTLRSLQTHLTLVESWARHIELLGMPAPKNLEDIYVELSLSEDPRGGSLGQSKALPRTIEGLLKERRNSVILGDLGSGKTTTLKKVALEILNWRRQSSQACLPIALRLRDFKGDQTLFGALKGILQIEFVEVEPPVEGPTVKIGRDGKQTLVPPPQRQFEPFKLAQARALSEFLNRIGATVLLDGLDELRLSSRDGLIDEIDLLAPLIPDGRIMVSSRSAEFRRKPADFAVYEIRPLGEPQVRKLVSLWFASDRQRRHTDTEFFAALANVPYSDLCRRPLALANLCLVFDKYGALPDQPI